MSEKLSPEEIEAIKGYLIHAADIMNATSRQEYGHEAISDLNLYSLFNFFDRHNDIMTKAEARQHYLEIHKTQRF